jgi:hypothetical protein
MPSFKEVASMNDATESGTVDQPNLNTLVERVQNLERENVRMKRLGIAGVCILLALGVLGQTKTSSIAEKLETRGLVLRDERGQVRGAFFVDGETTNLVLSDKSGNARLLDDHDRRVRRDQPVRGT